MTGYQINPLSFILLPQIDKANSFYTIVYEVKKDRVLKITPFGYRILKYLYLHPGFNFKNILEKLQADFPQDKNYKNGQKIQAFLGLLIKKEIILTQ
jgi:hypothetical protein